MPYLRLLNRIKFIFCQTSLHISCQRRNPAVGCGKATNCLIEQSLIDGHRPPLQDTSGISANRLFGGVFDVLLDLLAKLFDGIAGDRAGVFDILLKVLRGIAEFLVRAGV